MGQYCFLLLLFFTGMEGWTQLAGNHSIPLGSSAYSPSHHDPFSFLTNQGALAQSKVPCFGVNSERKSQLAELTTVRLVSVIPSSLGNFGILGILYGSADYRESRFGLAYARHLAEQVDLGIQLSYNGLNIRGYGHRAVASAEIGLVLHPAEKLHAGIHLANPAWPAGPDRRDPDIPLPVVFRAGWGYDLSEKLLLTLEWVKYESALPQTRVGLIYVPLPPLILKSELHKSRTGHSIWVSGGYGTNGFRVTIYRGDQMQFTGTWGIELLYFLKRKNQ